MHTRKKRTKDQVLLLKIAVYSLFIAANHYGSERACETVSGSKMKEKGARGKRCLVTEKILGLVMSALV